MSELKLRQNTRRLRSIADNVDGAAILDRVVATALRYDCGVSDIHPTGPWSAATYGDYCDRLARTARGLGCAADEIERALFAGKGLA